MGRKVGAPNFVLRPYQGLQRWGRVITEGNLQHELGASYHESPSSSFGAPLTRQVDWVRGGAGNKKCLTSLNVDEF